METQCESWEVKFPKYPSIQLEIVVIIVERKNLIKYGRRLDIRDRD